MKESINCAVCGKSFKPKDRQSKYCSKECYYDGMRKRPKYSICKCCGTSFKVGRNCKGVYCSDKCYKQNQIQSRIKKEEEQEQIKQLQKELKLKLKELKQRYERLTNILNHIRDCKECGKQFVAKKSNGVYCSDKCRKRNENREKDKRIYKNGKPDLSITLTKLYMRDKGVCQLCGRDINFDCDSNSNYYPSIDHIQPLAKGGLHSWDNVQLACRICNSIKQDNY